MTSLGWAGPLVMAVTLMTLVRCQPLTSNTGGTWTRKLQLEPTEAIVFPGDNVTFTCSTTDFNSTFGINSASESNSTEFGWEVGSEVEYEVTESTYLPDWDGGVVRYSRFRIPSASRRMSGEIVCSMGGVKAVGFLIVNGVRNGGACRAHSDCVTDRASCIDGICDCPSDFARLRIKEKGFDACREIIHSLYDPCEFDEQCANFVDPKSVCRTVCVCAPWTRDRRGKCVPTTELNRSRSQEMYRVGLIAVTCIIILIVAVSLWITLKRSCHDPNSDGQSRSISLQPNRLSIIDISSDKPPSYDDIKVEAELDETPPTLKDALKHSMTAKRLLRQVSAPAGQLIVDIETLKNRDIGFPSKNPSGC
ncbi:hypothetical protein JTE90_029671 [Oedothorax gibbosus]|uniref:EB domain-containing protein n=1 Tax=Oedothorax gibbosus TaxID=931172 RepID=A0AAV6VGJ8_9ARAC|nr:hypothetical protein JTE90_029671 [Oedothorax gibbosus]